MEIWKDISDIYQVSNLGNVRSKDRVVVRNNGRKLSIKGKLLTPNKDGNGYFQVPVPKRELVHRLVAKAFIPNPEGKTQVNHIDGNKTNNVVDNLEWCTRSENMIHAYKHGLCREHADNAHKATEKAIEQYSKDGDFIARYVSAREAFRQTGVQWSNISACARGVKQLAGGYVWRFTNG
jgi:hypothetical protein